MFKSRTVFVVGAGASYEVNLPTGEQLKSSLSEKLGFRFESGGIALKDGDRRIHEALKRHAQTEEFPLNELIHECRNIAAAMPLSPSIDHFLNTHQNNKRLVLCGKVGIVQAILEAEGTSRFVFDGTINPQEALIRLSRGSVGTWYQGFFMLLVENVTLDSLATIFDNVSFIVFNYDRCIEQFLYYALQNYYRLDEKRATALMQRLTIIHPYGVVGKLPWQDRESVPFGDQPHATQILQLSNQIKTFTEQVEDEATLHSIREQLQAADTVVFLGFAFHPINMALMKPQIACETRRGYATGCGLSDADVAVARGDISEMLQNFAIDLAVVKGLTCRDLFHEYRMTLSR